MNHFQRMMHQRLILSTLCPAQYVPTPDIKAIPEHAVVFAGGKVAIVCGPADDEESIEQARRLVASPVTRSMFGTAKLEAGTAKANDIAWAPVMVAIAESPSGHMETGGQQGIVQALLPVYDHKETERAAWLCSCTETAQAIDPNCPDLGSFDSLSLAALANFDIAS